MGNAKRLPHLGSNGRGAPLLSKDSNLAQILFAKEDGIYTSILLYFCTSVLLYFCTSVLLYFFEIMPNTAIGPEDDLKLNAYEVNGESIQLRGE